MSDSADGDDGGPGQREVAVRLFATEFDDADVSYSESDEERAPNYVITPTGGRVNRVFVVGVLTEVEPVSDDVLRARVVDPTGAFVCYAGQYQPDERAFLERADPPTFVALTGKARTFQPDDADVIYTSVRPESINEVDADTRDRWTVSAAEGTIARIRTMLGALRLDARGDALARTLEENGVEEAQAAGIPLALEHYETSAGYLRALYDTAVEALELVAGDLDEVSTPAVGPDATTEVDVADIDVPAFDSVGVGPSGEETDAPAEAAAPGEASSGDTSASVSDAGTGRAEDVEAGVDDESGLDEGGVGVDDDGDGVDDDGVGVDEEAVSVGEDGSAADEAGSETDAAAVDAEADGPGEFDLDEEEREAIESEYGTEFKSGTEVDEPGSADIDTPSEPPAEGGEAAGIEESEEPVEPDDPSTEADDTSTEADDPSTEADEAETEGDEDGAMRTGAEQEAADAGAEGESESAEVEEEPTDADLENVALEIMAELTDGGGADREAVVATAVDRTGASEAAIEDAIQAALMDGRCYEPADDELQPI